MVNQIISETAVKHTLSKRHTDRCCKTLTEWAGCGFDTGGVTIFWVTSCARSKLAKVFNFIQRHILKTHQIVKRIKQHGAMSG